MNIDEKRINLSERRDGSSVQITLRHVHADGSFNDEQFTCEAAIVVMKGIEQSEGKAGMAAGGYTKKILQLCVARTGDDGAFAGKYFRGVER